MGYGFGIIGCGMISRFHDRAIREVPGGKVVGCFDAVPAAADKLAAEIGCRAYHKLEDLLADPQVQIVTIGTPSGAHMEPAVAAAEAGKHVVVEKPLEITLDRCDRIIEACRRRGVKLATVFPARFHASSVALKQAVAQERFGRMTLGDAYIKWWRTQEYYDSGAWRGTWQLDGGGALMNQAIHNVDLLLWLMGPARRVTAQAATLAHQRIAVEDTVVATVEFQSGALGVIEATTAAYPGYLKRIELHGSAGSAVIEDEDILKWDFARPQPEDEQIRQQMQQRHSGGGGASDPTSIGHQGHTALLQDLVQAIDNDATPAIDGHEGRRSVELILAIYLAAETGRAVDLPLKSDPDLQARRREVGK